MTSSSSIIEQHVSGNIEYLVNCHLFDNGVRCVIPSGNEIKISK